RARRLSLRGERPAGRHAQRHRGHRGQHRQHARTGGARAVAARPAGHAAPGWQLRREAGSGHAVAEVVTRAPGPRVLAVVPAHDEEDTIARTVAALRAVDGVDEVVVVADGCRDRTPAVAASAGARVLATPRRLGKGRAVEEALGRGAPADLYLLI